MNRPTGRRARFDPLRYGIVIATLGAFVILGLLIVLLGPRGQKRKPARRRLILASRSQRGTALGKVAVREKFEDVA